MRKKELSKVHNKENMCSKTAINVPHKRLSTETILLSLTNDSDIISCSITDENKNGSLKTMRSNCRRGCTTDSKTSRTNFNKGPVACPEPLKNFRSSIRNSLALVESPIFLNNFNESPIRTPKSDNYKESNLIMKRIISTLKETPDGPFLSKSKLRNIQQWLCDNDVETIRTPPFANLSVTPVSCNKKCRTPKCVSLVNSKKKCQTPKWKERDENDEDSSLDSEVEGVLKAIYGNNWLRKNVQSRCKTEPNRKASKIFTPLTELKKRKVEPNRYVRRNILTTKKLNSHFDSDEENINLNNSVESGVKIINLDNSHCSEDFIKGRNCMNVRKIKKFDNEASSLESNNVPSTRKKKMEKVLTSAELKERKLTPKNSITKKPLSVTFTPKKTFLASLSVSTPTSRCHPEAQYYKINFKSKKEELVKKLYKLYNKEVFDGKLAHDLNFSWNVKLRGTAGYCYNKRITKSTGEVLRVSRIEFSTKIVDRADRLRDTMIHELCHAASWVIDGMLDGHGAVWSTWVSKAMERFPELPCIKRCHNYDIVSKYVYRCTGCGYSIKRHSKSINTERKRCGHCFGVLELLLNKKRKGKGEVPEFDTTRTLRTPNKFALFVKENYHSVKSNKANAKHAEIMKTLSQQYALSKNRVQSNMKSSG